MYTNDEKKIYNSCKKTKSLQIIFFARTIKQINIAEEHNDISSVEKKPEN